MEGCGPTEIASRINNVLGENTITARCCQQWVTKFKEGDFSKEEKERTGRPSLDIDDKIVTCLEDNRYATTAAIADELHVAKETVRTHLIGMGKKYLCNRWLPHFLTDEHLANRERICGLLLNKFDENNFLRRIVTVDEAWVYWKNDRSYHNRSWFGAGDTPDNLSEKITND